ncbi:hypothetical protein GCM10028801_36130 [Nocardioides maradonensis]
MKNDNQTTVREAVHDVAEAMIGRRLTVADKALLEALMPAGSLDKVVEL